MTLLTGLVLTVGIGTLAQFSEPIMASFQDEPPGVLTDDAYTVRAGREAKLDVFSNDNGEEMALLGGQPVIVDGPACGTAQIVNGTLVFSQSDGCEGRTVLTYGVGSGDSQATAQVVLNVIPDTTQVASADVSAKAAAPVTETTANVQIGAQAAAPAAPGLAAPSNVGEISPSEAMAAIRTRPDTVAPVVDQPDQAVAQQENPQAPTQVAAAASGLIAPPDDMATPSFGAVSLEAPAIAPPAAPQALAAAQPAPEQSPVIAPTDSAEAGPTVMASVGESNVVTPEADAEAESGFFARTASAFGSFFGDDEPALDTGTVSSENARTEAVRLTAAELPEEAMPTETAAQIIVPLTRDELQARARMSQTPGLEQSQTDGLFVADLVPAPLPEAEEQQVAALSDSVPATPADPGGALVQDSAADAELADAGEPEIEIEIIPASEAGFDVAAVDPNALPTRDAVADAPDCRVDLDLHAVSGGMIALDLDSKCRPSTLLHIEHAGMVITERTNSKGHLAMDLPALTKDATVSVRFDDGAAAKRDVYIDDIDRLARVVVAWNGDAQLDLHALEFGARPNSEGHVWAGKPSSYREARRSGGGFLMELGEEGLERAQVYTLPLSSRQDRGVVTMTLQVANGGSACGQEIGINVIRVEDGTGPDQRDILFSLRECGEGASGFVVRNAVKDIRVAGR
ncbi:hypothetical protein [Oceanomicrobium pacificus]|uniref:Uncharacterized protein n=1 Tax=Oceanomicrobium pacificus TaxID=2692916 RepID=A0A6B0TQ14_9RHOB|nr:hypothetical protein [Oceanomicrobium pacificus]MXU64769.1 hypothetical protein [Oceanomicrobium pacificus]